jgi:hypothetical protein
VAVCVLVLPLTGCFGRGVRDCPTTPEIVEVPRRVYVPVPDELTRPADIAEPRNRRVGELRDVAKQRKTALEAVNARLAEIRALAPPEE